MTQVDDASAVRPTRHSGYATGDEWTRRALVRDARAITRPDILPAKHGRTTYPRYFARGSGAYLWDVDGNRYVDYMLGYGPVVLGHADPRVLESVRRELVGGYCIAPLWSPRQVELTELLSTVIPGAEASYLMKTGSDANSAALRLARIHTGRNKVIRWGYNGWHDWAVGSPAGIPEAVRSDTVVFDHSPESLRRLFELYPDQIACVLTMPFEADVIPAGRLAELAEVTREHGAVFILDEMRSCFRLSLGGAQEHFGVAADLVTVSKAMANGHPISAVTGRADIMAGLARTRISSTFFAGPVEMAAAMTTIGILRDTDALARIWSLGEQLQRGLADLIERYGVPAAVVGYPPMPFLRFHGDTGEPLAQRFCELLAEEGVLAHPDHQWFLSAAHTREDVEFSLAAGARALARLADGEDG